MYNQPQAARDCFDTGTILWDLINGQGRTNSQYSGEPSSCSARFHPSDPRGLCFYIFTEASRFTENSHDFAFELLEKAGVAVTPGVDFGETGRRAIRFTYANSEENIREAARRPGEYLGKRCLLPDLPEGLVIVSALAGFHKAPQVKDYFFTDMGVVDHDIVKVQSLPIHQSVHVF